MERLYNSVRQYRTAIEAYEQAQTLYIKTGCSGCESDSLNNLGNAYYGLGEYQRAINFYQQSLEIARGIGSRRNEANSLGNLGNAYNSLGEYEQAINSYQQQGKIARDIGYRQGEASSLGNLGNAYNSLGQYQQAIECYQQSLEIQRKIGNRVDEALSLFKKALALAKYEHRRFEALVTLRQAREIYAALKLDHMVERCDEAIYNFSQIIATEQLRSAPDLPVAPKIGTTPAKDDWWKDSLPTPPKTRTTSQRRTNWILWFCVGLSIVLLIAWLRK